MIQICYLSLILHCWLNKLPSVKMKFILAFAIIAVVLTVVFGAPEPWNEYKVIFTICLFWSFLCPFSL
jgi:hypothetical protein